MRVIRSNDFLFLVGGTNDVLSLYDAAAFFALVPVEAWRARLAARDALFARLGIPWCQLLAPEKLSVLGEGVLAKRIAAPVAPGTRLTELLKCPRLLTPLDYLRTQRDLGYALYPRTDSHWSCLGALCAFQWAAPTLGFTLDYAPFHDAAIRSLVYHGDLWSDDHGDLAPDEFDRRVVPATMIRTHANAIVRFKERERRENEAGLHVGSHVAYANTAAPLGERLMLFGSSFSDYRVDCSLLTFIAALFFREVHFVWSTSLDVGLIERLAPDRVMIEMPERFVTACPTDEFDLAAHEAGVLARL